MSDSLSIPSFPVKHLVCAEAGCGCEALIGKLWCAEHYARYYRDPVSRETIPHTKRGYTWRAAWSWKRFKDRD